MVRIAPLRSRRLWLGELCEVRDSVQGGAGIDIWPTCDRTDSPGALLLFSACKDSRVKGELRSFAETVVIKLD